MREIAISRIKTFARKILFLTPHARLIYKLATARVAPKIIRNFPDSPVILLAPSGKYSATEQSPGMDKEGRYEAPLMQKFFESLDSCSVVLDIGAYVGLYSLVAGKRTQNIHSFEPDPYFAYLLRKNVRYSRTSAVIVKKSVGDKNSSKMITVDRYCRKNNVCPTHIKMDVEGYEMLILHGMNRTLTRHKPKLFVEFHEEIIREQMKFSQEDIDDFFEALKEHGYTMIFNGHHHEMQTSKERLYNFVWHSTPPNNVNYAFVAET